MFLYGCGFPNYNFFYNQFRNIKVGKINWEDFINEWVLLKTSENKWIFGRIDDYYALDKKIKILALIDEEFRYTKTNELNITELWVVDSWKKFAPSQEDLDVSGEWKTSYENMVLTQSGNKVTGTYTHQVGKINGILKGNVLKGTWSQKSPDTSGNIEFEFTETVTF